LSFCAADVASPYRKGTDGSENLSGVFGNVKWGNFGCFGIFFLMSSLTPT
jgi:hypothetical protein